MGGKITEPVSPTSKRIPGYLQYLTNPAFTPVPSLLVLTILLYLLDTDIFTKSVYRALLFTVIFAVITFIIYEIVKLLWFSNKKQSGLVSGGEVFPGTLEMVEPRYLTDSYSCKRQYECRRGKQEPPMVGRGLNALSRMDYDVEKEHKMRISSKGDAGLLTNSGEISEESDKRFDAMFNQVKIGVAIYDTDGNIVKVNPALERVIGFSQQELRRRKFTDLIHPDDMRYDYSPIVELMSGARDCYDIEKRLVGSDGQIVWVRMVGNRIDEGEGNIPFIVVLIDDISDRKEEERTKDAFIGMVSHELKNPLMAVISSLRMAKREGQFPEVMHELISIASDGAEELWVILENMLEISRARTGRLTIVPVSSSLSHLVSEVIPNIKQTLVHNLVLDIPEDLPSVVVDPARIQLILRNLLDNAVKYSPKGGNIVIFAKQTGREILVGVKDEGVGISKSALQNLFQPFERLGMNNVVGMGLGLAVCRVLVELHKGRIWMESETGKGSTCCFTLPLPS